MKFRNDAGRPSYQYERHICANMITSIVNRKLVRDKPAYSRHILTGCSWSSVPYAFLMIRFAARHMRERLLAEFPQPFIDFLPIKVAKKQSECNPGEEARTIGITLRQKEEAEKKRGQAPLRHTLGNRPLLPSGPGGVELLAVAQDLTSKKIRRQCRSHVIAIIPCHGAARAQVELIGFEPTASSLRTRRSPS